MALAWAAVAPIAAQTAFDLASSGDGSALYFSQAARGEFRHIKLYRWTPESGTTLFAERPDLAARAPGFGQRLYGTRVTADGVVFFHAEAFCSAGTGPSFNDCTAGETQVMVPGRGEPYITPGYLLVSPNGRYGVYAPYKTGALWMDWETGEEMEVTFPPYFNVPGLSPPFEVNRHAVADNGSFLIAGPRAGGIVTQVWTKAGVIDLPLTDLVETAAISGDGNTVAITARELQVPSPAAPTIVHDLVSGRRTRFAQRVSLSADGQTLAWLDVNPAFSASAQAMVSRPDGSGVRRLSTESEGLRSAVISGDGRFVYAVSNEGRIRRYQVSSGAAEDVPSPAN